MKVNLPDGAWAELYDPDEITERMSRALSRAQMKMLPAGVKLADAGYDESDPTTWPEDERETRARTNARILATLSDEDQDAVEDFQTTLVVTLVKEWSLADPPTFENVPNLKKPAYDALVTACQSQVNATQVDTEAQEIPPNPKAPTSNSSD